MKTIQMTLDDNLVTEVDFAVKKLHTSRSAFARKALREALQRINISKLEQKHKAGYAAHPVTSQEFSVWEDVQEWGDK